MALLVKEPTATACATVLELATGSDRLALHGRELFWLPDGKILDSELEVRTIEDALGQMTWRTRWTVERIAARYFAD